MQAPRVSKHEAYYELMDACKVRGCPICRLALHGVRHYLDSILYESINDPPTRIGIVASRGYCNDHSWQLRDMRAGLGAAILYRDVIRQVVSSIRERAVGEPLHVFSTRRRDSVLGRITAMVNGDEVGSGKLSLADPHTACPACQVRERCEQMYLGLLLDVTDDLEFLEAFRSTGGLCFVHIDQAAAWTHDEVALDRLLGIEVELLSALDVELGEFLRKHDYRFAREARGGEVDSWIRALAVVAGQPGIR